MGFVMAYDPHKHHRRSIRLKGYDYSQDGLYFITISVKKGLCLFGDVVAGEMQLNDAGQMVEQQWLELPSRFPQIELDSFRVMPNHFHGILGIRNSSVGAGVAPAEDGATTRVARTTGDPSVRAGLVPALSAPTLAAPEQDGATTRVARTGGDPSVRAGLVPAPSAPTLAAPEQDGATTRVARTMADPPVGAGFVPEQDAATTRVARTGGDPSVRAGLVPAPSAPTLAAPEQEGATTRVARTTGDPSVRAGLVPALSAPTLVAPEQDDTPMRTILGNMVGAFKSITTHEYITGVKESGWTAFPGKLWHRNYYEHIIRNERSLNAIREYISNNPANWTADQLYPDAPPNKFNAIWQEK
jgi:REP element-mobilizing transposase RayT